MVTWEWMTFDRLHVPFEHQIPLAAVTMDPLVGKKEAVIKRLLRHISGHRSLLLFLSLKCLLLIHSIHVSKCLSCSG